MRCDLLAGGTLARLASRLVPMLDFPGAERHEDHVGGDQHDHRDPEHEAPLLHGTVGNEEADNVRRDDARQRPDGVHQGHDGARVVGREVQGVDPSARVVRPHGGHAEGEQGHDEVAVAAGVRCTNDPRSRTE